MKINSNKLLIIGAGGHGLVVGETAIASKAFCEVFYLDDCFIDGIKKNEYGLKIIGSSQNIFDKSYGFKYKNVFVAIGEPTTRMSFINKLKKKNFNLPSIIHPSAIISPTARIGNGSVILPNSIVCAGALICDGVILNTACTVDHNCIVSDGSHICPGVNLAGDVEIGKESWIGIGACVKQGIRIGSNVTVGAGASVINDLPDLVTAFGVPAKIKSL